MSVGVYNETYFARRPEEKERDGVLYGVVLVNRKTYETTCAQAEICLIGNINTDKFINYNELNQLSNG